MQIPDPPPGRRTWICPGCQKPYFIPNQIDDPVVCAMCDNRHKKSRPPDLKPPPLTVEVRKPTREVNARVLLYSGLGLVLLLVVGFTLWEATASAIKERKREQHQARLAEMRRESLASLKPMPSSSVAISPTTENVKEWYEGGNLHDKSALDWQEAEYSNKLATCADFLSKLWRDGSLKSSIASKINSIDDIKPLARNLVQQLDDVFEKETDPDLNNQLFENQTVSGFTAIILISMGWVETK